MRAASWCLVLSVLFIASSRAEDSTALIQIPKLLRDALGTRDYQIQVPELHPVKPVADDDASEDDGEEEVQARVESKLAKFRHNVSAKVSKVRSAHLKAAEHKHAKFEHLAALVPATTRVGKAVKQTPAPQAQTHFRKVRHHRKPAIQTTEE
eukprot:Gregarina_sp_Pseudo_9__578@NODE_1371_length_1656_cov_319_529375_g1280_i0_p1_GENE_NODE_1371_length_1656_cov_319_529375_g1280_i0NODE_1371_length_1656_cov_319_529375_g1280_i0_p1_ORF_typecomplete_len152_score8_80_NODE_1371_length_1656_cov_319_529375_g1280_i09411396